MADHSFLFIPDISGFTRFVNTTEISHSQHIISELLELIIDSDELGLEVSEVEGDAVLFFGKGSVPSPQAIMEFNGLSADDIIARVNKLVGA